MNSFYDISRGQLITLWIFGFLGWISALDKSDYGSGAATIFSVLLPFLLFFYTIGWKNRHSVTIPNSSKETQLNLALFLQRIKSFYWRSLYPAACRGILVGRFGNLGFQVKLESWPSSIATTMFMIPTIT